MPVFCCIPLLRVACLMQRPRIPTESSWSGSVKAPLHLVSSPNEVSLFPPFVCFRHFPPSLVLPLVCFPDPSCRWPHVSLYVNLSYLISVVFFTPTPTSWDSCFCLFFVIRSRVAPFCLWLVLLVRSFGDPLRPVSSPGPTQPHYPSLTPRCHLEPPQPQGGRSNRAPLFFSPLRPPSSAF